MPRYPNYLEMQASEFSTNVRARRKAQEMASPCQTLQRSTGFRTEIPKGMMINYHLLRYKMVN
ncbi:MAG: hypothetical protein COA83_09440 [Methylophaga sp.]|nr:MAG: hypothetical protein COA83_09440 [Methylophaga sp.]